VHAYKGRDALWYIERKGYNTYCVTIERNEIARDFRATDGYLEGRILDFALPPDVYQDFVDWIRHGFPDCSISQTPITTLDED
jgi:hypothetical protein